MARKKHPYYNYETGDLSRDRKLSAQQSRIKITNQSHTRPERSLPRMGALEGRTIRGYLHNGRFVWG